MRILLVVQPDRFDFYSYMAAMPDVEWHLLWYEKPGQMTIDPEELPLKIKQFHYWTAYATPQSLLNKIRPDRIVFFEIIDLRQIALLVASKKKKCTTFYLEHGAAGDKETAISRWHDALHLKLKRTYFLNRLTKQSVEMVRAKYFYFAASTFLRHPKSLFTYLSLPFRMLGSLPNKVLSAHKFPERVPDYAIIFNKANLEEFELYTGIEERKALLTGIPFFDKYFTPLPQEENFIVYIDTPFIEGHLLGWDEAHHEKVARSLESFARTNQIKIFIKLHPRSDKSRWDKYDLESELFEIIQFGEYTELYLKAKLILGYSSSLITGLICARKNIVIPGWHPEPTIFGVDFSNTGLCHTSLDLHDLETKYSFWVSKNLCIENAENYHEFIQRFNDPFDGKATSRVLQAIQNLNA